MPDLVTYTPRTPPILEPPIRLAVCVSGAGTTLQNLIQKIQAGSLSATITRVIASRPGIRALDIAQAANIPVATIERKGLSLHEFSDRVFNAARAGQADLVILGGFLSLLRIPQDYHLKVINIHPSLIPAFCGKGFHGAAVHEAVLASGAKLTGCTVHFADNTYDTGPIISQHTVPVLENDTPQTLAMRVFEAECEALPAAITKYAAGPSCS